jgi:hypothetical protein
VAQGDPSPPGGPGSADVQDMLTQISKSLIPRGYLTTEWWTTIIGGAVSAVLALVHVSGSNATHVAAVVAPAVLAALYAITRTMHKSALASLLGDVFPQATGGNPSAAGSATGAESATRVGAATGVTQPQAPQPPPGQAPGTTAPPAGPNP